MMLSKKIMIPTFALAFILSLFSFNEAKAGETVFNVESVTAAGYGKAADFTWTQDGKKQSFKELTKGKVVFLNFWGTWCGPCRRELPDIVEINKELSGKDFIIVGIALERSSAALESVRKFAKANNLTYINILDNDKRELSKAFGGISAVPTTYIIDQDGKIAQRKQGMGTKQQFLNLIKKVLNIKS